MFATRHQGFSQSNVRNVQAGITINNNVNQTRSISEQLSPKLRRRIKICLFTTLSLSLFASTITMASLYAAQVINNNHLISELDFERQRSFLMCSCLKNSEKEDTPGTLITLEGGVAYIKNESLILPLETAANLCQVVQNKLSSSGVIESSPYLVLLMSMMAFCMSQFQPFEAEDEGEQEEEEERSYLERFLGFCSQRATNLFNNCRRVVVFVSKSVLLGLH